MEFMEKCKEVASLKAHTDMCPKLNKNVNEKDDLIAKLSAANVEYQRKIELLESKIITTKMELPGHIYQSGGAMDA